MKIGIDVGGSHIGVGLVDERGNIILKKETDFIKKEKLDLKIIIIDTIVKHINQILRKSNTDMKQIEYIGIAFPKSLRNNTFGKAVNLGVTGYEIKEEIQNKIKIPVYMKNDAKCAAICEKRYGGLKKYANAVFLTIGTGIGGALFLNHTLICTTQNDLFKIGHMIIQKDGIECKCGKRGCFEKYASITALKQEVTRNYNISEELTGVNLYNFIIENLQDEKMQNILNTYIENLSMGISNIINLFEPEAIAIGGSFAYYNDIFLEKLEKKLKENQIAFGDNYPKLLIATYKNDAGIIGAANIV